MYKVPFFPHQTIIQLIEYFKILEAFNILTRYIFLVKTGISQYSVCFCSKSMTKCKRCFTTMKTAMLLTKLF